MIFFLFEILDIFSVLVTHTHVGKSLSHIAKRNLPDLEIDPPNGDSESKQELRGIFNLKTSSVKELNEVHMFCCISYASQQ